MRCNVATWDRSVRFILAVLLLIWLIAGGPIWAALGVYLLMTAAWGFCPLYVFFKVSTLDIPDKRPLPPLQDDL